MRGRLSFAVVLVSVSVVAPLGAARAEPVCAADVRRLCPDVPVGGGEIQACLKEKETQVSEACRKRLDDLPREVQLLAVTCRWDIARFCSDTTFGGARIVSCLEGHRSEVAPLCREQLGKLAD
jgi:hypothetical protein